MGAFYGSIYLRIKDRNRVRSALEGLAGDTPLLLAPALDGWVGVYPAGHGQDSELAGKIARAVGGAALYVFLHDGDLFGYCYYRDGEVVDEYCSDPDYFEPASVSERERLRGRPELLAELLSRPGAAAELEKVLHPYGDGPGFALAGLALMQFARFLRLPNVMTSYEDLMEESFWTSRWVRWPLRVAACVIPPLRPFVVRGRWRFVHLPDRSAEIRREQQRPARRALAYRQLQAEGLLRLFEVGKQGWFFHREARVGPNRTGDGFFVVWTDVWRPRLVEYAPPWPRGGRAPPLAIGGAAEALCLSPSGRLLALGDNSQPFHTAVWDVERGVPLLDLEGPALGLDFAPDEQRLLAVCRGDVTVFDLTARADHKRLKLDDGVCRGAFDPTGRCILFDNLELRDWRTGEQTRRWRLDRRLGDRRLLQQVRRDLQEGLRNSPPQQAEQYVLRMAAELQLPAALAAQIMAEARANLEALRASLESGDWAEQMADGTEGIRQLCFSADGRLLLCATDKGVRVYEWQRFLQRAAPPAERPGKSPPREVAPAPLQSVKGLPYQEEGEDADSYLAFREVYALAYDAAGGRLLHGGMGGAVGCLDLATGQERVLIELPGRPVVWQLSLSRDGSALACVTRPQFFRDEGTRKLPAELSVWNYPALLAAATRRGEAG